MLETARGAAPLLQSWRRKLVCFGDAAELKITLREYVRKEPLARQESRQLTGRWMGGDRPSAAGRRRSATRCSQRARKQGGFQKITAVPRSALKYK